MITAALLIAGGFAWLTFLHFSVVKMPKCRHCKKEKSNEP